VSGVSAASSGLLDFAASMPSFRNHSQICDDVHSMFRYLFDAKETARQSLHCRMSVTIFRGT
jgi:hypothetical protein